MSDKIELYNKAKARIANEMAQDEQYKAYFSRYRDTSIKSFIESYAGHQANLEVYGDFTKFNDRFLMEEWQRGAWDCLKLIQHKKLLDITYRWQAEEVKNLPGIEVSVDFTFAEEKILDLEAIPNISEEEFEFLLQFLNDSEPVKKYYNIFLSFQDGDGIRKHYKEDGKTWIPYYDYHNKYTGNYKLMSLPKLRRAKEKAYIDFAYKAEQKKKKKEPAPPPAPKDERPALGSDEEDLIKFAKDIKDLKTASFITDHTKWKKEQVDWELTWAAEYLSGVYPDKVAVSEHSKWDEAIYMAAVTHKQKKVGEVLPSVYQEYLMKRNTGIPISPPPDPDMPWPDMSWYKEYVLKGRELKGEPRDLDF